MGGRLFRAYECDDRPQTRRDTGAIHMPDNTRRIELAESFHQTPILAFVDSSLEEELQNEERSRRPHHNLKFIPPGAPTWVAPGAFCAICKTALAATLRERSSSQQFSVLTLPSSRQWRYLKLYGLPTHPDSRPQTRLADHFWQRWLRDFIDSGARRARAATLYAARAAEGDIVLIVDSSSPDTRGPRQN
ncbi:hypothetical protein EVAR_11567_1 [Eumeta japonica]|uniref:Uncharacterized protein n=1 Tax=Eumeta variegata TaxID=151549 RepID=A0A4C1X7F2_EUMVA|nr:hypothetical protein EVAR_11567_1 [Eumeta japonica]